MLLGNCHCGAVKIRFDAEPEFGLSCNCSICRRLGTVWIYSEAKNVTFENDPSATTAYAWGDKNIEFHTCKTCGCTTHWANTVPDEGAKMAVNMMLCEPKDVEGLPIRRFDGAETWTFLD